MSVVIKYSVFFFLKRSSPRAHTPSIGKAKVESLKELASAHPRRTPRSVEPTLAPMITPTPLVRETIPAPTNTTVITETIVLLCVIHAKIAPETTDFRFLSVNVRKSLFNVETQYCKSVLSIIFIPKRNIPSPPRNPHMVF